jgi:hypothetical protein
LEPLQQEAEGMIEKLQEEKGKLEKIQEECIVVLVEHLTTQSVEKLVEQRIQVK